MNKLELLGVESHFAFGKNWLDYSRKIDDAKIAQAILDLQRLSGLERLDGRAFLDIGCGSGLHSLAAVRLGAARVLGVDIDSDSVTASQGTIVRFAPSANAQFRQVSVFDMRPEAFSGFDLVYSWGVLHHTGDMQRALTNAAALVQPGGLLMLALYKKTPFCGLWRRIKRWYSTASPAAQGRARDVYIALSRIVMHVQGLNLDEYIRDYGKGRGMDYYNDVHDWMGGYPYESISPQECHEFFECLGFRLEREFVKTPSRRIPGLLGSGCDEYVFIREIPRS